MYGGGQGEEKPEDLLDRRLYAYRADLAAESLRGRVDAPRYAKGDRRQVVIGAAPLRRQPRFDAPLETELLRGETVMVYDDHEGWAWVQSDRDRYVGYAPADALSRGLAPPTHRVKVLRSYLYPAPDIKAPPLDLLSLNALVAVAEAAGPFAMLKGGGFVIAEHLASRGAFETDFVAVAKRFVGTPYLWGGRTSIGIDCSALVQIALQATGRDCMRDTDMQERAVGAPLPASDDLAGLRRGDLIFWKGHVGVMVDAANLLHANAHHMAAAIEPAAQAVARIAARGSAVTSIRRIAQAGT